jgi:hypothetical protein
MNPSVLQQLKQLLHKEKIQRYKSWKKRTYLRRFFLMKTSERKRAQRIRDS